MKGTFRFVRPRVGEAAVHPILQVRPIVDHVIAPAGKNNADVGRAAAAVEHRRVTLQHRAEILPAPAAVGRSIQDAAAGVGPVGRVAFAVIAHVEIPLSADRINEKESIDRPLKRRATAMDRVARYTLEGIEGGITVHGMPKPKVRLLRLREVSRWHGAEGGSAENDGEQQTA